MGIVVGVDMMTSMDHYLHDAPPVVPRVERGVLGLRADGGGEEEQVRAQQGHAAGGFGEPLWGVVGTVWGGQGFIRMLILRCVCVVQGMVGSVDVPRAWLAGLTHALL